MAKRIEHQKVSFPTPNKELLDGMALAGYNAFANCIDMEIEGRVRNWDECSEFVQDGWIQSSRAMYAFLAVASGAKVTQIPEKPKEK